jgi:hypothetical protein
VCFDYPFCDCQTHARTLRLTNVRCVAIPRCSEKLVEDALAQLDRDAIARALHSNFEKTIVCGLSRNDYN